MDQQGCDVRFVPKADICSAANSRAGVDRASLTTGESTDYGDGKRERAASILLKLENDSRYGRFLFDRVCDPQHRNLPINLTLAEMGDDHGRETPPRKSDVVLSISRWPLAK